MIKKSYLSLLIIVAVTVFTMVGCDSFESGSQSKREQSEQPEQAEQNKQADNTLSDEQRVFNELSNLGLDNELIPYVIELMKTNPNVEDFDSITYAVKDRNIADSVNVTPSQTHFDTVNLIDYYGLRNEHAYIFEESSGLQYVYVYLGKGIVEGDEVYARATYSYSNALNTISLSNVSLYQYDYESVYMAGKINSGKVSWHTEQVRPFIMEVGKEYTSESDLRKDYYTVLGFRDVTIDGKTFNDCIELQAVTVSTGQVLCQTWYYSKDFGFIFLKTTTVSILNEVTASFSESFYVDDFDMASIFLEELHPFMY